MKKLLILAGVIAITCSTQVFAEENCTQTKTLPCPVETKKPEPPHCQKMDRPKCGLKKFEDELNLSDKQKEQAKQLREKQMEAAKPIIEALQAKEDEVQALREQLHNLRIEGKKEFEAILTDKQLKKLQEIKAERKDLHHKRHLHKKRPMPMHHQDRAVQK